MVFHALAYLDFLKLGDLARSVDQMRNWGREDADVWRRLLNIKENVLFAQKIKHLKEVNAFAEKMNKKQKVEIALDAQKEKFIRMALVNALITISEMKGENAKNVNR